VLHLPERPKLPVDEYVRRYREENPNTRLSDEDIAKGHAVGQLLPGEKPSDPFRSGHFPEPNIIGHMMTSTTSHQGKPVYTVDQIQSDWGQKLRDGGVRDEAKIAGLRAKMAEADPDRAVSAYRIAEGEMQDKYGGAGWMTKMTPDESARMQQLGKDMQQVVAQNRLLSAELRTAETAAAGHPLVNNTDQWTNTTLRRALTQAANSNAEYLAIPSGKTVLGYNPGDLHGMTEFYDKIVPKNLKNILQKLDKEYPAPQSVPTLDSPSGKTGLGKGFSLFPLPEHIKNKIKSEGLPLFARGIGPQPLRPFQDEE
jgi:hypothetical protein